MTFLEFRKNLQELQKTFSIPKKNNGEFRFVVTKYRTRRVLMTDNFGDLTTMKDFWNSSSFNEWIVKKWKCLVVGKFCIITILLEPKKLGGINLC